MDWLHLINAYVAVVDANGVAVHREGRYASRKARAFSGLAIGRLRADPALQ